MEGIIILGKTIINDIKSMNKKSLDISLIEEEKSDLTFFNIDEEETNETLKALKQKAEELDLDIDFEVDGGIKENNVAEAVNAGANIVVVGTALVYAENPKEFVSNIKSL